MNTSKGENKAEEALKAARLLSKEGRYQEALAKHVWFHEHALEICESYYGVRLSFALFDWVELGKKHPPALQKLSEIRDAKSAKILAGLGEVDLFHDVQAINRSLGESHATIALFKKLDRQQPGFAGKIAEHMLGTLASAQEYELARKHLQNPRENFSLAKENFEHGVEWATATDQNRGTQSFENIFTDNVITLIRVLKNTGDTTTAREIQKQALEVLTNPGLQSALQD